MLYFLSGDYCSGILGGDRGFPAIIGDLIHYLYLGIKIVVPILLVIFGMLDLGKAITAKKEEDIKKYQGNFVKRIITGLIVFLVVILVEFVIGFVEPETGDSGSSPTKCAMELIKGRNTSRNKNVTAH